MDHRFLKSSINSALKEFGFINKRSGFYLHCADVILIVFLRKSTHGNYYYLDCGINLMALSNDLEPKSGDCHIKFNFNLLAGEDYPIIVKALDLESAKDDDVATLNALIKEQCAPQFLGMSSLTKLRDMYKQGQLKGTFLLTQATEVLESNLGHE